MSSAAAATATEADAAAPPAAIVVRDLSFDYGAAAGHKPVLHDVTFALPRGAWVPPAAAR
jgi:hypothetical protein